MSWHSRSSVQSHRVPRMASRKPDCLRDLCYGTRTGDALYRRRSHHGQSSPPKSEVFGYWGCRVSLSARAPRNQAPIKGQLFSHRIDRRGLRRAGPLSSDPFRPYSGPDVRASYGRHFPVIKRNRPAPSMACALLLAPSSSALRVAPTC